MNDSDKELREAISYHIVNVRNHYESGHPDPDQTKDCIFAIDETIDELFAATQAFCEQRGRERAVKELDDILQIGSRFSVATKDGPENIVPWYPNGLWRYLHDRKIEIANQSHQPGGELDTKKAPPDRPEGSDDSN